MKSHDAILLLSIFSLACPVLATPQSPQAQQGQNLTVAADNLAQRIRENEEEIPSVARTAALRAIAEAGGELLSRLDPASALWGRVHSDRLYALSLAGLNQEVVAAYRTMQARDVEPPAYVIPGIAQALADTGNAYEAGKLLQRAQLASPHDSSPAIRYAYLQADQGRYDAAIKHLEEWISAARVHGSEEANAQLVLARLQRWDERFDASVSTLGRIDANVAGATLVLERAALLRQRGRPRAAIDLLGRSDKSVTRELLAQAWMDLGRPDRARDTINGKDPPALRQRIDASLRGRGIIAARYAESRSAAINSPSGAQEVRISGTVDGPWLGDGWRIGAQATESQAEFRGSTPVSRYAGARLVRAVTGGEAVLQAGRSFDKFLPQSYVIFESSIWTGDHLRLGSRVAVNDPESSLQARASAIGSDSAAISTTYRSSESLRIDAGFDVARFDDGNRRGSLSFGVESRLLADSSSVTSAFASVYTRRNSLDDPAYFSPRRDTSFEAGLVHGFRGFGNSWQTLRPSLVHYRQDGFRGRFVPRLGYSNRFSLGTGRWWRIDLTTARPVYDGIRETQLSIALSQGWGD